MLIKNINSPKKKGFLEMVNKPPVMSSVFFFLSTPIRHELLIVTCAKIIHEQLVNSDISPIICNDILLRKLKRPK